MRKRNHHIKHGSLTALCLYAMTFAGAYANAPSVIEVSRSADAPVYGWCTGSDTKRQYPSIWQIGSDNAEYLCNVETMNGYLTGSNLVISNGFLKDGVVSGYIKEIYSGNTLFSVDWVKYNLETGDIVQQRRLNLYTSPVFNVMAYVPEDNLMYGVGNFVNQTGYYFMAASPDAPDNYTMRIDIDQQKCTATSFCYNGAEDCFYLINTSREIVRIQKDGYIETLATIDLDNIPNVYTALWYNAEDNKYYWNPNWDDHTSIVTLDVKTGKTEVLYETPTKEQYSFFFSDAQVVKSSLKPAKPEFAGETFPDGALSGTLTYKLPADAIDGSALDGQLRCYAVLDGVSYGEYTGTPGAELNVEFTNLSEGEHLFTFYVATDRYDSDKILTTLYIGVDTPDAPENVSLEDNKLSWSPVTTSVHGGYVDYSAIVYEISLNGESAGTTTDTEFILSIPDDSELAKYKAEVVAVAGDKRSEAGISNAIVAGAPLNMPLIVTPTQEDFNFCSVIDANQDSRAWFFMSGSEYTAFALGYTASGVVQDEWLFLPPIAFESADTFYNLDFLATTRASGEASDEYLSVCIAKKPTPEYAEVIMEEFRLTSTRDVFEQYNKLFQVEEAGTYYIGFHCTSAPDQTGIMLRDIKLSDSNLPGDAPDVVTELSGEVEAGESDAIISFTFPTKNLYNTDLDTDCQLVATVTSTVESVTVEGTPGSEASVKVKVEDGDNIISVTVSTDKYNGPAATIKVHAGVVAPETATNIKATVSEDMMSVHLTWDAVTTGVNNGYIIPEDIKYQVCEIVQTEEGLGFVTIGDPTSETCYDYGIEPGSEQRTCQLTVLSFNSAGDNGQIDPGAICIVGTPYTLPYSDDFEPAGFNTNPWLKYTMSEAYTAQWGLYWASGLNPAWGNDVILWSVGESAGALGREGMPRFSTMNIEGAVMNLDIYVGDNAPKMTVLAEYPGCESPIEIAKIAKKQGAEFENVEITLPAEVIGRYWVGIFFEVEFDSPDQLFALNSVSVSTASGVAIAGFDNSIIGTNGKVILNGYEGMEVSIYTLDGRMIVNGLISSDNAEYNLNNGIYIVKAGEQVAKVSVQ